MSHVDIDIDIDSGSGSALVRTQAGPMFRPSTIPLLLSELSMVFRRRRTWAMLLALAAVPVLLAIAVKIEAKDNSGSSPAFLDRTTRNGLFVVLTAMVLCVPVFLPLTVGLPRATPPPARPTWAPCATCSRHPPDASVSWP